MPKGRRKKAVTALVVRQTRLSRPRGKEKVLKQRELPWDGREGEIKTLKNEWVVWKGASRRKRGGKINKGYNESKRGPKSNFGE